jgi:hypothetical protein
MSPGRRPTSPWRESDVPPAEDRRIHQPQAASPRPEGRRTHRPEANPPLTAARGAPQPKADLPWRESDVPRPKANTSNRPQANPPPPLPFSRLRNGVSALRVRHDFPPCC